MADLWHSKFHKVIETKNSLTILSATAKGVEVGNGQLYGFTKGDYKSISIFADLVVLGDPDPNEGIVFGSTSAQTVTLSTSQLVKRTQDPNAIISARGQDGKPNDTGGEDGRAGTHGSNGNMLNVFVGESRSSLPNVLFDARGGHGEETNEIDQPGGAGGMGGHVNVVVAPTWVPIVRDLKRVIRMLGAPKKPQWDEVDSDDDDDDTRPSKISIVADEEVPEAAIGCIVGLIRDTCRLCQADDPLRQMVLDKLAPLFDDTIEHTRLSTVNALVDIRTQVDAALDKQALDVRNSVKAPGGKGGSGSRRLGRRTEGGKDGQDGTSVGKVWMEKSPAGPLSFAPLHPLQCRMQLEKAAALYYFDDENSRLAAQSMLARLYHKMTAVLDICEDDSPDIKALSEKAQEARKNRLMALERVYESQRDLIGIPAYMTDPVGELRRIGREVRDMLFQLNNTSVDYYNNQDNWVPRQSVEMFQAETQASIAILEKSETLFLALSKHKDKVEKNTMLQSSVMEQVSAGRQYIAKERIKLVDQLNSLNRRIQSRLLNAEIERKRQYLIFELQDLERTANKAFEIGLDRLFKAVGNVAKDVKLTDVVKREEIKKPKDNEKDPDDKKAPTVHKRPAPAPPPQGPTIQPRRPAPDPPVAYVLTSTSNNPNSTNDGKAEGAKGSESSKEKKKYEFKSNFGGIGKKVWDKTGGEVTDMVWEGMTSIPTVSGSRIDKWLIVRQIGNVIGDLNKMAESSQAKITRDPRTNAIEIDPEQDKLLVASQTQIDKFIDDFLGVSSLGSKATAAKKALQAYSTLLTDRNHDRVQWNLVLKSIVKLDEAAAELEARETRLQEEGRTLENNDQLSQMAQMLEDIYSWNRAQTMRLISDYGRAIYLHTLDPPKDNDAGGRTSDAALTFPAARLHSLYMSRHTELFERHGKAGSDPARFENGKCIDLSPEDLQLLLTNGYLLVQLRAPGPNEALGEFDRVADVRFDCVRFWLPGIKLNRDAHTSGMAVPVKIALLHDGNSVYYHPCGEPRAFRHDEIQPSWSYRLLPTPHKGAEFEIMDDGVIIRDRSMYKGYAPPSPFATWTISIESIKQNTALDLSDVRRGYFQFFGTNREFWQGPQRI